MRESFQGPERVSFGLVDIDTVRPNRHLFAALGIAFVVLGIFAIFVPYVASLVTAIVIGWLLVIAGLLEGYHATRNARWAGSVWETLSAIVQVVAGLLLVAFPVTGKLLLTVVLAAYFVSEGVLKLIRARQHRTMNISGFLVFDGLISMALGIMILMRWPSSAVWALGLLVGINLIIGGSSMLLIGFGAAPRMHARM